MAEIDLKTTVLAPLASVAAAVDKPEWTAKVDDPAANDSPKKAKKKKRSRKTTASRGATALSQSRGTGLEEYYADPPMTPQEAQDEEERVYADDLMFEERIQSCIQRFRTRRRLQTPYNRYFDEYLFVGGIDSNTAPFSGQDLKALKDLTPAERREATATSMIHQGEGDQRFYNGDTEHWSVDFAGVAAGFFSYMVPKMTGLEETSLKQAVSVVDNFLRYVLQHNVCPEHADDVKKAIEVCGDALVEWPMILRLQGALPGHFNIAAAEMFGVHDDCDWSMVDFQRQDLDPKLVLLTSLALMNEPKHFAKLSQGHHEIIRHFDCTVQISDIQRPSEDVCKRFKGLLTSGSATGMSSIGKIKVTPTTIEDDLVHPKVASPFTKGFLTLFFDDEILANMKVGMKMEITVCQTDSDLKFVKTMRQVVPSFYTFLPQEMVRHFREPRPSGRPARSVHDVADNDNGEWEEYQEKLKDTAV